MFKLIAIAVLVYALVTLLAKMSKGGRLGGGRPREKLKAGEMVACARCGTFILKAEAIENGGHPYCSPHCQRGGA